MLIMNDIQDKEKDDNYFKQIIPLLLILYGKCIHECIRGKILLHCMDDNLCVKHSYTCTIPV